MPSSKSPTSLRIGAGRIPANVVSASALTSLSSAVDTAEPVAIPVVSVNAVNTTLTRTGAQMVVLVNNSTGSPAFTITLPDDSEVGDSITFVGKTNGLNTVSIDAAGEGFINGAANVERLTGPFPARAFVCTAAEGSAWATSLEKPSIQTISTSSTLERGGASMTCLVDATGGDITVTLPQRAQVGDYITFIRVAPANGNSFIIDGYSTDTIDGLTTALRSELAVLVCVRVAAGTWLTADSHGLVDNFTTLGRADGKGDATLALTAPTPMFNWSQRRVAIHAEFTGPITNFLPVEGFTAGGTMSLERGAADTGTVGVMRCKVPAGTKGWLHLGELPIDDMFRPSQLLGFRAILSPITANPGVDYHILVGFGDDISDNAATVPPKLGNNGLYLSTGSTGFWQGLRVASNVRAATTSTDVVQAGTYKRYVIELLFSGSTWDVYVNGHRTVGGANSIPTAMLNFGMLITNGGGVADYQVDVDSFTVFTLDMGATRHT